MALRLAESHRALGNTADAAAVLGEALAGGLQPAAPLWMEWFAVCAVDRGRRLEDIESGLPSVPRGGTDRDEDKRDDQNGGFPALLAASLRELEERGALRINSGGGDLRTDGRRWRRDRFYVGGRAEKVPSGGPEKAREPESPRHTERRFAGRLEEGYRVPLFAGRYRVTVHPGGGRRSGGYEVRLEGEPPAPREATVVDVRDGILDIEFIVRSELPGISGVEIERVD
jgi:hypothetical protein